MDEFDTSIKIDSQYQSQEYVGKKRVFNSHGKLSKRNKDEKNIEGQQK